MLDATNSDEKLRKQFGWLVTINTRPETEPEAFKKKLVWLLDKVWLKDYIATVEVSNKKDVFSHPHVHLFCRKTKAKSEMIRECFSTFSDLCENRFCIDVKQVSWKGIERVKKYLVKDKPIDVAWRKKYGFSQRYTPEVSGDDEYEEDDSEASDNDQPEIKSDSEDQETDCQYGRQQSISPMFVPPSSPPSYGEEKSCTGSPRDEEDGDICEYE